MTEIRNSIIYGDQNFTLPSHMNCAKYFLDKISSYKDKHALINGITGEYISYKELAQKIVNTASALRQLKILPGDVIGICSENRIEYPITMFAALSIGAVVTFFNPNYSRDELVHTVSVSKPKYVFLSPNAYKVHFVTLKNLVIIRKFFIYGNDKEYKMKALSFDDLASNNVPMDSFRHEDFYGQKKTAIILYSSGTTGLPKGAKISHLNLIISLQQPEPTSRPITLLTLAPWCNTIGLINLADSLTHGKTVVFITRYDEELYLQIIEKYKVEMLLVVPPIILMLSKSSIISKYDVSSVKLMHCGGSPLESSAIIEIKKKFPNLAQVLQGYGMTEMTGALSEELETAYKQGSVGKIMPGNVVKIVDVETRKVLGPNLPGEVCAKGLVLFDGYIGKPLESDCDEEGFYRTGDIAYYDEDCYLYIIDRIKELIKYKGWQVAPSELEAILFQHPAVKDVGVVGAPDPLAGELPAAFVVKQPGSNVTEKDLLDFVVSKVSPWKQLRGGVRFINEIPKTGSGKILRRKLRDLLTKPPVSKL